MKKILIWCLNTFTIIILFILILAINSANHLLNAWGEVEFGTVLYQLASPLKGTNSDIIDQYCQEALSPSIIMTVVSVILWYFVFYVFRVIRFRITGNIFEHEFMINVRNNEEKHMKSKKILLE